MYCQAIGIDLGTTNSLVGIWRNNKVEIIKNENGQNLTPSFVSFSKNKRLVGEGAKNNRINFHESTIYDSKRLIGRRFKDDSVQYDINLLAYKSRIKESNNGRCEIEINELEGKTQTFKIEQIAAMILQYLKKSAEQYLNKFCNENIIITEAVITVPAYFNENQRQATKDAALIAGLKVLRIINEPTAASIAYKINNPNLDKKNILIFDLGGGTFDVSILSIDNNDISVLATKGISHLGGIDFDKKIYDYCITKFEKQKKINLSNNEKAKRRIMRECENAKKMLSAAKETNINIPNISNNVDLDINILRTDFEFICEDLFQKCMDCVKETINIAKLKKEQIDNVIKVGGSSRIPKIQELLKKFFRRDILNKNISINADEAVTIGAAYYAASIKGCFNENHNSELILIDISGISLGYDNNGQMDFIFSNIRKIPNIKSITLENKNDNKEFKIKVFQDENKMSKDNYFLKDFIIYDSKKNDKDEIKFEIDVYAILHVYAKKDGTNKIFKLGESKILSKEKLEELMCEKEKELANKLVNMCEKLKELINLDENRNRAINVKSKLMRLFLEKYEENKNPIFKEFIDWLTENPNETAETYEKNIKIVI